VEEEAMTSQLHTEQYGFFLTGKFDGKRLAHLEATTFSTREECLKAARACRKAGLHVLNMFSLDLNSGTMRVIYDAVDLDEKLDSLEREERTDEEKEEQPQIDLDNSRHGTTL